MEVEHICGGEVRSEDLRGREESEEESLSCDEKLSSLFPHLGRSTSDEEDRKKGAPTCFFIFYGCAGC